MHHVERYLPTIKALATRALDMAVDASPNKPREGEFVCSLMVAVPVARSLLGETDLDLTDAIESVKRLLKRRKKKVVDGLGHDRLAYHFLLYDLTHRVILQLDEGAPDTWPDPPRSDGQIHHDWLHMLCEERLITGFMSWQVSNETKPLHQQKPEDSPDAWVYRELVGLHGVFGMFSAGYLDCEDIAGPVARYHLQHTQPDYTTYQPWALAAFLWFPETVGFAEQQLHDVQTHLSIEGPAGALVPGLLLADAYATLRELLDAESPSE